MAQQAMRLFGDKQLIANLNALPDRVYRKIVRQSIGRATTPMKKAMKREAKKRRSTTRTSGQHLFQTLKTRIRTYKANSTILAVVGPKHPEGAHGHLVEWGHRIVAHGGQSSGGRTRAFNWMLTAYNATKGQSLAILQRELVSKVETSAAELGRANA